MGKTKVIKAAGLEVVCRELSVADVRAMLSDAGDADVVDGFLFEDVRLQDIKRMTSLEAEQIEAMRPSELRVVADACKEANPHFFEMAHRLSKLAG